MPIRKDLAQFYRGTSWFKTRSRILARAGDGCEECGKPNGRRVFTFTRVVEGRRCMWWVCAEGLYWRDHTGKIDLNVAFPALPRNIRVVLTIAHLNHAAGDDRDENLKALCQWCHLNYDKLHHRETRSTRKDATRPILRALEMPEGTGA
jgi:protein-arginine kinase activator protein McsA